MPQSTKMVHQFLSDPANGFRPATRRGYRDILRRLPDKPLGDITEQDLVDIVTEGDPAEGTKRTRLTVLRSFFSWATWQGHIDADPSQHVKKTVRIVRRPARLHNWLDEFEVKRLLDGLPDDTVTDKRNQLIFRIGFATGLRRVELINLRVRDVDLDTGACQVHGKNGKLAIVRIPDSTLGRIRDWVADAPADGFLLPAIQVQWNPELTRRERLVDWHSQLRPRSINTIFERLGVPISPHDMRRSFAGIVHDKVGLEGTSQLLRHENIGTTQTYLEGRQDAAFLVSKGANLDF